MWEPLVVAVGERLAEGFMWMHEDRLEDRSSLHAYKHVFTRRYLYLIEEGARSSGRRASAGPIRDTP